MAGLKSLKELYTGRQNIENHISLFSIMGIFIICFVKLNSFIINNLYENVYFNPLKNRFETAGLVFFSILIGIYLVGYFFNSVRLTLNSKGCVLSDFSLKPFSVFVKTLPALILWDVCYFVVWIVLSNIINLLPGGDFSFIVVSLLLCFVPFFIILVTRYLRDFKLTFEILTLKELFIIIRKNCFRVVICTFRFFIWTLLVGFSMYMVEKYLINTVGADFFAFMIISLFCINFYVLYIILFLYVCALGRIGKLDK